MQGVAVATGATASIGGADHGKRQRVIATNRLRRVGIPEDMPSALTFLLAAETATSRAVRLRREQRLMRGGSGAARLRARCH